MGKNLKPSNIALIIFSIIFLIGVVLISYFGETSIFFSVIMLMLQAVIAVCLSKLNYACLFIAGVIELIFGIIANALFVTIICLVIYFCALYVLHILNKYGFRELPAKNATN